eukprot:383640_1
MPYIHYLLTIYCVLCATYTTASWTPATSTGYWTLGKSATPLGVCINRNKNGEPFSRKYDCNSDKSAVMISSWRGYNCNTSSSNIPVTYSSEVTQSSSLYFDCTTSVKYWMGMSYGNQTGTCAQEDANWEQAPLVVQQCIAVTYLNGKAASGQARWIRNCDSCSCERVHYKTASCTYLTGDHAESISVGCVNGLCKVADLNQCSIEQKCPVVNTTTTAEPAPATTVIKPKVTNSSGEYYIISHEERAGSQSITCSSANCHVLCSDSFSCTNLSISAYDAISLTVECPSNRSCIESNIMCPKQNLSSIDSFSFCDISCGDALSCANATIELHAVHSFNLLCTAHKACSYAQVVIAYGYTAQPRSAEMGNMSVQCTEKESCEHMRWASYKTGARSTSISSHMMLDTLDMQCTGEESCQFMRWTKYLFLDHANVQCIGYKSCQHVAFSDIWSRFYVNIHCGASLACYAMYAELLIIQTNQTIISCDNPATSSSATGSCYQSHIKFGNYPSHKAPGNISISCNAFDCENMEITFGFSSRKQHLSLHCNDEYACHDAYFDGGDASSFDVYCKGTNACSHTNVWCPADSANVCNIHCTDGEDVCASFGIKTRDHYTPGSVAVFCESMDSNPSCNDVHFQCGKKDTWLKYNDGANNAQCVVNETVVSGDDYCCPLFTKNITNSTDITEQTTTISTDIIGQTATTSTHIVEPTVTNPKDEREENKKANKSWPIAVIVVCVAVVTLIVITCVLTVFVVKKRRKSERSPALLLDDNDAKQGTYAPPKAGTEMTKNADI